MNKLTVSVQRVLIAMLLLVAVVERFAWAAKRGWVTSAGEATNVAAALAEGRGFADAYFVSSGPTAHLMPTTPLLAGGVNWLFGRGVASEIILQAIASTQMVIGYLLLYLLFARLGMALLPRLAALATLCILPEFLGQESLDFRYWEGGLAVVLATASLIVIVDLEDQGSPPDRRQIATLALLFAATFFTSPSLGLGIAACSMVLLFRKPRWRNRLALGGIAAAAATLVLTPWVVRNDLVLGKPILLRSNMPLELTLANNDWQYRDASKQAFDTAMTAVHPTAGGPGQARVRQVGELAYMSELSRATNAWIARHPDRFAALCARHLRQMFFPDAFQFEIGSGSFSGFRAAWYAVISALGLLGIAINAARGRTGYLYICLIVAIVAITYVPFQPMARYLYLNYGLLLFGAYAAVTQFGTTRRDSTHRHATAGCQTLNPTA